MELMTPFGLRQGRLVAPADVPSGLACDCTCPGCGTQLVAKKGTEVRWHFAHLNGLVHENCAESAIHAAAKQVLTEHGALVAPEFALAASATTLSGAVVTARDVLSPTRLIRFDRTVAEVGEGDVRPDVVGYRGDRRLFVEMFFRHRVDEEKRAKLERLGVPCIEVDLSELPPEVDFDILRQRVIEDSTYKTWVVYPGSESHRVHLEQRVQLLAEEANRKDLDERAARARERKKKAEMLRTKRDIEKALDDAFAGLTAPQQEAALRKRLGIAGDVPALLCQVYSGTGTLTAAPFLWQASVFERFVFGRKDETTKFSRAEAYACISSRFGLPKAHGPEYQVVERYLWYLTDAGFLESDEESPHLYSVRHDQLSMPAWCSASKRFDDQAPLPEVVLQQSVKYQWTENWPRWRWTLDEAQTQLAASPNRDALLEALTDLSGLVPPATPQHWAAPLVQQGVPIEDCMTLLVSLGLAVRVWR